jgi:TatD DNase family protein
MIDTHAHIDGIADVARTVENSRQAGICRIIGVGMDQLSNDKTMALARRFQGMILPAIGYHPWSIRENAVESTLAHIQKNLKKCVALGEVGLDYRVKVPKKLQRDVFDQVLDIARALRKPVIVHCRYSHARCHKMVFNKGIKKAVFHWYSGPLDILEKIIQDGYYISATPALAYSPYHQKAIRSAPLERILVETDSPVAYQNRIAEPAHLIHTIKALSRIKKRSFEETARITTEHAKQFFAL